ncbi:unnamed protein product [Aphanomyces euteiches]
MSWKHPAEAMKREGLDDRPPPGCPRCVKGRLAIDKVSKVMVVSYAGVTDRVDCPEFGLLSYQDPLKGICRGFKAKDKVKTPRGNGAVVGVADGTTGETVVWLTYPSKNRFGATSHRDWRLRSIQIER